jgi:hypothetical protein
LAGVVPARGSGLQATGDATPDPVRVRDGVLALEAAAGWQLRVQADDILELQDAGYFVVLVFVGLVSAALSIGRVATRRQQGGHAVPVDKLIERFPRTQAAVGHAAPLADMTLFFDNSRSTSDAFALVRVQQRKRVLFDCRDEAYLIEDDLLRVAQAWLPFVVGAFPQR